MRIIRLLAAITVLLVSAVIAWRIFSERGNENISAPLPHPGTAAMMVYLVSWDDQSDRGVLTPVKREISRSEEPLPAVINSLLQGPTAEEAGKGLSTDIPLNTRLLDFSIEKGVVFLDFSREIEAGGGSASIAARLAQVVFTATEIKGIEAVHIMVDGRKKESLGGEGAMIESPLSRSDVSREF